jgi:hypothetical protein
LVARADYVKKALSRHVEKDSSQPALIFNRDFTLKTNNIGLFERTYRLWSFVRRLHAIID